MKLENILILGGSIASLVSGAGLIVLGGAMDENWYIKAPGYALCFASGAIPAVRSFIKTEKKYEEIARMKKELKKSEEEYKRISNEIKILENYKNN